MRGNRKERSLRSGHSSCPASAAATGWNSTVTPTNKVSSSPVAVGGYPVPPGATRPDPGTCGPQQLNSNHSESWLAVKPGTEDIVGNSKFFIGKWSTFYDVHLGHVHDPRWECRRDEPGARVRVHHRRHTGHAAELDEQHGPERGLRHTGSRLPDDAAVQRVLGRRHASERRDRRLLFGRLGSPLGQGERRQSLDNTNNQNSITFGHVEDKQWIVVNHIVGNVNQDHVYAMWTTFNGANGNGKIMVSFRATTGRRSRMQCS
jgi:hypothetical protein